MTSPCRRLPAVRPEGTPATRPGVLPPGECVPGVERQAER